MSDTRPAWVEVQYLQAPPAEIPVLEDPALPLTGISSDISQVYGSMVDAYLHQDLKEHYFLFQSGSGFCRFQRMSSCVNTLCLPLACSGRSSRFEVTELR